MSKKFSYVSEPSYEQVSSKKQKISNKKPISIVIKAQPISVYNTTNIIKIKYIININNNFIFEFITSPIDYLVTNKTSENNQLYNDYENICDEYFFNYNSYFFLNNYETNKFIVPSELFNINPKFKLRIHTIVDVKQHFIFNPHDKTIRIFNQLDISKKNNTSEYNIKLIYSRKYNCKISKFYVYESSDDPIHCLTYKHDLLKHKIINIHETLINNYQFSSNLKFVNFMYIKLLSYICDFICFNLKKKQLKDYIYCYNYYNNNEYKKNFSGMFRKSHLFIL